LLIKTISLYKCGFNSCFVVSARFIPPLINYMKRMMMIVCAAAAAAAAAVVCKYLFSLYLLLLFCGCFFSSCAVEPHIYI